ncbi:MAG: sigma 54-interacting transcriptional regulator [Candidatus Binatia bacterium]
MTISILSAETQTLLDSLPEAAFAVSLDKRLVGMNAAAEALTGMTVKAARSQPCADVVRCEACGASCPLDAAVAEQHAVTSFNVSLTGAHGVEPVSLHTAPLRDAAGEIVGVLECARPIGHLVGLFQALQEKSDQVQLERNKVQAVLDSIAEGVFTVDRNRIVTSINRTGARIVGHSEVEIVGKACHEFLGCRAECAHACPVTGVLDGAPAVTNFETEYLDRAGHAFPVSLSISALRDEHGAIIGAVEAFRDLRALAATATTGAPLISGNPRMRRIMELVEVLKDSDATVLLHGESGTGKGLLAETIHRLGNRARKPFVKVNCGALPEGLLESELFGHVKGAFTGAIRDAVGRFALADGGTAFLDEVGELSPATQVKLLRFLQEQEFERVGSTKTVRVNVRVIAATNQDLHQLMTQGRFRADLFYRLNVIPIELPPLRERPEDIPALIEHILARLASKGRKLKAVAPAVMDTLLQYPWPGNIRELENTLEHAVVCSKGSVIELEALPRSVLRPTTAVSPRTQADAADQTLEVLARHRGNQSAAARALGISRSTLWRRLKKLGTPADRLPQ